MRRFFAACLLLAVGALRAYAAPPGFDLTYQIEGGFDANELQILNDAIVHVEGMWENVLTGYQPVFAPAPVLIHVWPTSGGLASALYNGLVAQGGFTFATGGDIYVNTGEIENFANWQGDEPNGLNFIDELLAHETGHVLGIGTLWNANGVYIPNTYHYTGQYGVAAYKAEFDPTANWIPVENAGGPGTPNAHWDQKMRSGGEAGDPSNPWILDPRVGVTDSLGRDRALELMTGAIDPDFLEPFISRFTVESMRDMGYTVAAFEDFNSDGVVNQADLAILNAHMGETGLQIDSIRYGDADRNRVIDMHDFQLWQAAAVPEPAGAAIALLAALAVRLGQEARRTKGA